MNEQPDHVDPDEYLRRLQEAAGQPQPPSYQQGPHQPGSYAPYPPLPQQAVEHPSATTSMVLGIIGLASIPVFCGLGLLLSPIAWVMGARAVTEIDAVPGRFSGRDRANAGKIMGIIGTVLLVLGVVALALFIALVFPSAQVESTPYQSDL